MLARVSGAPRAPLQRLGDASARAIHSAIFDWETPIDRTRQFYCETLTPLYYTPVYDKLAPEHRLRYNQLTGMLSNELILFLETEFLDAVLRTCGATPEIDDRDPFRRAVRMFRDDERRHAEAWRRLNRLSAPGWYEASDRFLVRAPPGIVGLSRLAARHCTVFPVVLWIQLLQEERSIDISRRCLRLPAGVLEPRYAAVYRAHLADEVRHVQLDAHLIDRFYSSRPMWVRHLTAIVLRFIVGTLFLRPLNSTVRVIDVLAREFPELGSFVPEMRRQLRRLDANGDYQEMAYSRRSTPVAFGLFDRFPEFRRMQAVLRRYRPARPGGRA